MADENTQPHKQKPDANLKTIRLEYYHSAEGYPQEQREKVRSLGFTHVGQVLVKPDTLTMHHIVSDVPHLIRIIE